MRAVDEKREMIDRQDKSFAVEEQCEMMQLLRSTFHSSTGIGSRDHEITRLMDEMNTKDPTRGTRRYSAELTAAGNKIGRDRVRTFMM